MAIRNLNSDGDIIVDVEMKNGNVYTNCDIPLKPFGNTETIFSFYSESGDLIIAPMTEIVMIKMRDRNLTEKPQ